MSTPPAAPPARGASINYFGIRLTATHVLCFIAALALFVSIISPHTRRIAREQVQSVLRLGGIKAQLREPSQPDAFVRAHPDDPAIQLAAAFRDVPMERVNDHHAVFARLMPLLDRFPNSPLVCAALLRRMPRNEPGRPAVTPAEWAVFDRGVARGQRLEPDNAFFTVRAWSGYDQRGQPDRGMAELLRAAGQSRWNEHLTEKVHGLWRLKEADSGVPSGIDRLILGTGVIYPQYSGVRDAPKAAVRRAHLLEASGRVVDGVRIRHAVMHVGSLMRSQSTVLIGNLIGIAIAAIATREIDLRGPQAASLPARRAAYEAWLTAKGFPDGAAYARREFAAADRTRSVMDASAPVRDRFDGLVQVYLAETYGALAVLLGALFTLLSARVAFLLARWGYAGDGRPRRFRPAAATVLVGGTVIAGLAAFIASRAIAVFALNRSLSGLEPRSPWAVWLLCMAVLLAGPILLKLIYLTKALISRRPYVETVVQGFKRKAFPLAALMVIAYTFVQGDLARRNLAISGTMEQVVQNEGRYSAEAAGLKWPN